MSREQEFELIKNLIKTNYEDAKHGLFNCRNVVGDSMETLYDGKHFALDICYYWAYFEVFGTSKAEFTELQKLYKSLGR